MAYYVAHTHDSWLSNRIKNLEMELKTQHENTKVILISDFIAKTSFFRNRLLKDCLSDSAGNTKCKVISKISELHIL